MAAPTVPPTVDHFQGQVNDLFFSGAFDSGNLRFAKFEKSEYRLWTRRDCEETEFETAYTTWFHFSARCRKKNTSCTFAIMNMNKQANLYKHDMRVIHRVVASGSAAAGVLQQQEGWCRIPTPVSFKVTPSGTMQLRFKYSFRSPNDTVYFAFCYPYSYEYLQHTLEQCERRYHMNPEPCMCHAPLQGEADTSPPPGRSGSSSSSSSSSYTSSTRSHHGSSRRGMAQSSVYFHRELLCRSLEGRRIDLVTISSREGMCAGRREPRIESESSILHPRPMPQDFSSTAAAAVATATQRGGECSPVARGGGGGSGSDRAHCFESSKRVVVISARVHPGETPASHVMHGVLSFLLNDQDPRAAQARRQFVFKLIPMLNPDGVANGHYRTDTRGVNLNRFYHAPSASVHPSIYAAKSVALQYHREGRLALYVDLHAHSSKRGCFFYGNYVPDPSLQVLNQLYARLVAANTPFVEMRGCDFSEKNMNARDKRDGLSKSGSGRVGIYNATQLPFCYTLECNYNQGTMENALGDATAACSNNLAAGLDVNLRGGMVLAAARPRRNYSERYTQESWQSVGRALVVALLDFSGTNPLTRLGKPIPSSRVVPVYANAPPPLSEMAKTIAAAASGGGGGRQGVATTVVAAAAVGSASAGDASRAPWRNKDESVERAPTLPALFLKAWRDVAHDDVPAHIEEELERLAELPPPEPLVVQSEWANRSVRATALSAAYDPPVEEHGGPARRRAASRRAETASHPISGEPGTTERRQSTSAGSKARRGDSGRRRGSAGTDSRDGVEMMQRFAADWGDHLSPSDHIIPAWTWTGLSSSPDRTTSGSGNSTSARRGGGGLTPPRITAAHRDGVTQNARRTQSANMSPPASRLSTAVARWRCTTCWGEVESTATDSTACAASATLVNTSAIMTTVSTAADTTATSAIAASARTAVASRTAATGMPRHYHAVMEGGLEASVVTGDHVACRRPHRGRRGHRKRLQNEQLRRSPIVDASKSGDTFAVGTSSADPAMAKRCSQQPGEVGANNNRGIGAVNENADLTGGNMPTDKQWEHEPPYNTRAGGPRHLQGNPNLIGVRLSSRATCSAATDALHRFQLAPEWTPEAENPAAELRPPQHARGGQCVPDSVSPQRHLQDALSQQQQQQQQPQAAPSHHPNLVVMDEMLASNDLGSLPVKGTAVDELVASISARDQCQSGTGGASELAGTSSAHVLQRKQPSGAVPEADSATMEGVFQPSVSAHRGLPLRQPALRNPRRHQAHRTHVVLQTQQDGEGDTDQLMLGRGSTLHNLGPGAPATEVHTNLQEWHSTNAAPGQIGTALQDPLLASVSTGTSGRPPLGPCDDALDHLTGRQQQQKQQPRLQSQYYDNRVRPHMHDHRTLHVPQHSARAPVRPLPVTPMA